MRGLLFVFAVVAVVFAAGFGSADSKKDRSQSVFAGDWEQGAFLASFDSPNHRSMIGLVSPGWQERGKGYPFVISLDESGEPIMQVSTEQGFQTCKVVTLIAMAAEYERANK